MTHARSYLKNQDILSKLIKCRNESEILQKAQEGNSRVRLEMTDKMLKMSGNVKNVKKWLEMLNDVKKC